MAFHAKSDVSVQTIVRKELKVNKYIRIILRSLPVPQSHKKLTWDSGHVRFCRETTSFTTESAKEISDELLTRGPDLSFLAHGKPSLHFSKN